MQCSNKTVSNLINSRVEDDHTCVCDALVGSKKVRLGPRPSPENLTYIQELVNDYVDEGQPIEAITMWRALKAYGLFGIDEPDLLDAMALRRLKLLNDAVKRFYEPGLQIHVLREDLTEFILSDCVSLVHKMQPYANGLRGLADAMGVTHMSFEAESGYLSADLCEHVAKAHYYAGVISCYLLDAVQCGFHRADPTPLGSIGWHGGISEPQYRHYVDRTLSEMPTASLQERHWSICLYLGNSLARAQAFRKLSKPVLKLSLMAHPPGVSEAMRKGRLEYKVKDSKNSHKSIPPWAGFGVLYDNDWKQVSVNEYRDGEYHVEQCEVNGFSVKLLRASA